MEPGAEVLIDPPMSSRGEKMLRGLVKCMPPGSIATSEYRGTHRVLVIYGPGAPRRLEITARHRAAGGRVAMWDLGYWDRDRSMRLSIDAMHPTAADLDLAPPNTHRRPFKLREDANPDGPILLVGLGRKSCVAYGYSPMQWERRALESIRERFPNRPVYWRPKGKETTPLPRTQIMPMALLTIEQVLRGCSLVVCRHSNVAVDACVAGVPVECEDGAAVALYAGNPNPTAEQRAEFLRKLAWWNWGFAETASAWRWIMHVTKA